MVTPAPSELSHRSRQALRFAVDEARSLRMRLLGPEHLLLGLCHEQPGSIVDRAFARHGVSLSELHATVVRLTGRTYDEVPGTVEQPPPVTVRAAELPSAARAIADHAVAGEPVVVDFAQLTDADRARLRDCVYGIAMATEATVQRQGATRLVVQPRSQRTPER